MENVYIIEESGIFSTESLNLSGVDDHKRNRMLSETLGDRIQAFPLVIIHTADQL